jgi:CHASE3 domain sensor protein
MKARKAIKRLHRVETLLGTVIDQDDAGTREVHDLLDAARKSVASATQAVAASPAKKPPATADKTGARKLSDAARKRLSVAAKKRWAAARRNGMSTLAKSSRKIA